MSEDNAGTYGQADATDAGSCADGGCEGDYEPDGEGAGRLPCFVDAEVAAIVWTDEAVDVLSFAYRDDRDLPVLYDAWSGGVGPDRP